MTFTALVLLAMVLFLLDGYPVKAGYRISTALLRRRGLYRRRTRRARAPARVRSRKGRHRA